MPVEEGLNTWSNILLLRGIFLMTYLNFIFETIKILTPFIIALIVYRVWHNQKGKEVIANFAQNSIMDLLEEVMALILITEKTPLNSNLLNEELIKFSLMLQKSLRSTLFIGACIEDDNLIKAMDNYNQTCGRINKVIDFLDRPISVEDFKDNVICTDLKDEFIKNAEILINELKPYSIYQK
ncbi:hypothetical protein OHW87_10675 [Acinetobacter baumannii]|nr:hypothetical protein [Acinetobacter baumannii]